MYKPNRRTWLIFQKLKKENIWEKVTKLEEKYQKRWKGPAVDIYIFPINSGNFFRNSLGDKGGVSFKESMFLFLSPLEDDKELEALFIHEYHHVCRLNKQKKDIKEYSLLDSIVLEGLAEHAVEYYCGKNYKAKWCDIYSDKELNFYWEKLKDQIAHIKREEDLHDEILFGYRGYPKLLGYSLGYFIVKNTGNKNFSTKINFYTRSEYFSE